MVLLIENNTENGIGNGTENDTENDTENSTEDNTDNEAIWFWNESANESESDSEDEGHSDIDEEPLESDAEQSKTEDELPKGINLKWNREGENKLKGPGAYGKGSRSTDKRQRKLIKAMKKAASQTPHIGALFQRQLEMAASKSSDPLSSLSQLPRSSSAPKSKIQLRIEQRLEASKDLTRLLNLVTEQEKKYGERLLPYSNFHRRHLMVQHFLNTQETTRPSQPRKVTSLSTARCFKRGHGTARNIVQWENAWVDSREIPRRKERNDYESWMDDESLRESIRDFARKQDDCMK